jgi:aminoglycoside phosphotransferase (APT) family kinase protein
VTVAADLSSGALLADRASVLGFWRDELGRTDEPREVEFLPGGVSSIVVRVATDAGAYVIKQALPRLRVEAAWFSRPERSTNEARAAVALAELVPGSVPEIVATATDRSAFVMRSAPGGSVTWKDLLMAGEVSPAVAVTVGRLLGRVHATSAGRVDLAATFADQSFFDELRIHPYLRYVAAQTPDLATAFDEVVAELLSTGRCLVHGDFSPKNLLVAPDGRVLLVDHEVAHWGQPAFDTAFVTSHLCLKAIRFRARADDYLQAAVAVLDAYAEEAPSLAAGIGPFAARVTGALLIARVDGMSPVEYLIDQRDRALARALGRDALLEPPGDPWAMVVTVRKAIADA